MIEVKNKWILIKYFLVVVFNNLLNILVPTAFKYKYVHEALPLVLPWWEGLSRFSISYSVSVCDQKVAELLVERL